MKKCGDRVKLVKLVVAQRYELCFILEGKMRFRGLRRTRVRVSAAPFTVWAEAGPADLVPMRPPRHHEEMR
jgi:hypothetical protein